MSKPDETATGVTEETFDFLEWLDTGTIARRQVVIYNDHATFEEYVKVQERLDELGHTDEPAESTKPKDGPLSGDPAAGEIADLLVQRDELLERLDRSKATWTVRAISQPEMESTFDVVPVPKQPMPPKDNAPAAVQEKWLDKLREYQLAAAKATDDRNLAILAIAVVGVETARGSVDHVTFEQLKAMRSKPHGAQWIERLRAAVDAATTEDAAPPLPS